MGFVDLVRNTTMIPLFVANQAPFDRTHDHVKAWPLHPGAPRIRERGLDTKSSGESEREKACKTTTTAIVGSYIGLDYERKAEPHPQIGVRWQYISRWPTAERIPFAPIQD